VLPVVLDPTKVRVALAGEGNAVERRRGALAAAGVRATPIDAEDDLWSFDLLFVAGTPAERARRLAGAARAVGVLVNVEDVPELCDFHVPAVIRRGDLLVTVSTNGRAPGLARAIRARLECAFGEEWNDRTREIAHLRGRWRWQGLPPQQVSALIEAHIAARGWLA
jgi:precorrin-2 dehydrogenase/sirohydrochlorin ferrochelatase